MLKKVSSKIKLIVTCKKYSKEIDITKYQKFQHKLVYLNSEIDTDKLHHEEMNVCQSVNDAIRKSMDEDEKCTVFGEDVAFGGVFRCTNDLKDKFGEGNF